MSALSKGAGPGKETLEPLPGKSLSIPASLPQAGQSWKKPLEMSPRETGSGASLAPASNCFHLSEANLYSSPSSTVPAGGQGWKPGLFLWACPHPVQLSPDLQRVASLHPGGGGQCGPLPLCSMLSAPGGQGLGQGSNATPWGYSRARPLGSLLGHGPHSFLCPG